VIKLIDVNSITWCPYCDEKTAYQQLEVRNKIYHCLNCDMAFSIWRMGQTYTMTLGDYKRIQRKQKSQGMFRLVSK
jgi:hypothetical protein